MALDVARSRPLSFLVLCASALLIIVDSTIVTVALPTIRAELNFTGSSLTWVVNAYLIAFAGLLLIAGRVADIVGAGRVFVLGLALFTLASMLCGIANSQAELIGYRFLQGAGGALSAAVALGMLTSLYPEPRERAKALGAFSFVTAAGSSMGLILGGLITQTLDWRWVFWVNLPIGIAATALAWRLFIEPTRTTRSWREVDVAGAVLATGGLAGVVFAVIRHDVAAWTSPSRLPTLIVSLAMLAGFVLRQRTAARPLIPLRLLAGSTTIAANATIALMLAALFGFQFLTALYLRETLDLTPLETGLAFLPGPLGTGIATLGLSARLIDRFGARSTTMLGLIMVTASLAWLARVDSSSGYWIDLAPAFAGIGLGFGIAMPALLGAAMSNADETDVGIASALVNATQQVGAAIGVAVLATVATTRTDSLARSGIDLNEASASGFAVTFLLSCALAIAALGICWRWLTPTATGQARID